MLLHLLHLLHLSEVMVVVVVVEVLRLPEVHWDLYPCGRADIVGVRLYHRRGWHRHV